MQIVCKTRELREAVGFAKKMLPKATTLPVLEGIMLEAQGGEFRVMAHDLECGVILKVGGARIEKEGRALVPGRAFSLLVEKFTAEETAIDASGGSVVVKCGSSRAELAGMDTDLYPELPSQQEYREVVVVLEELLPALRETFSFTNPSGWEAYVRSVLWEVEEEDELNLVATDTHRLVVRKVPGAKTGGTRGAWLLPVAGLARMAGVLSGSTGHAAVRFSENFARIITAGGAFYMRLLSGSYPPYRQVIPREDAPVSVVVDAGVLRSALERARVLKQGGKDDPVVMIAPLAGADMLTVKTVRCEYGALEELLEAEVRGGSGFSVYLNSKYLLSALRGASDKVVLSLYSPLKPVVVRRAGSEDYLALVLPVRAPETEVAEKCA